jgi:hypothetical protein
VFQPCARTMTCALRAVKRPTNDIKPDCGLPTHFKSFRNPATDFIRAES